MRKKTKNFEEIDLSYTFNEKLPWKLNEDLELKLSNSDIALIPKGLRTNFASVPRFLWGIFPPYGQDIMAFLFHDYVYIRGHYQSHNRIIIHMTRKQADIEMLEQQRKVGISPFRYYPMYWAVRLFGWMFWRK